MIRNAVLHLLNEQPLMADLFAEPAPTDLILVCTNLRLMDGKRPAFADRKDSTFIFSWHQIRFVEIAPRSEASTSDDLIVLPGSTAAPEPDLEIDEDFLKRIRDI